jgi:hypothetical protein
MLEVEAIVKYYMSLSPRAESRGICAHLGTMERQSQAERVVMRHK